MSANDHIASPDPVLSCETTADDTAVVSRTGSARLQTIHALVRSGSYHIPASAIADRMIERILFDKADSRS